MTMRRFLYIAEQDLSQLEKTLQMNVSSHWLRPCSAIERKQAEIHDQYKIQYTRRNCMQMKNMDHTLNLNNTAHNFL